MQMPPSNKTLVMIGGIPTHPMESMTWFADCLNQIDASLRIIIFNMPYYEHHFHVNFKFNLPNLTVKA